MMGAPNCPTPSKRGYKTARDAKRHLWTLWTSRKGAKQAATLHTYKCACGMFHVGHARKRVR